MRILKVFFRALMISLLLSALMFTVSLAEDGDFSFSLNSSKDAYIVSGYAGSASEVKVPDWHGGLPVTEIGASAFEGKSSLQSVTMPSTISRIGKAAFKNCPNLTKISSYAAAAQPPEPDVSPGDVNGDDVADYRDALQIMQYSAGWSGSLDKDIADVNGDNTVSVADAVLIFQYDSGENVELK